MDQEHKDITYKISISYGDTEVTKIQKVVPSKELLSLERERGKYMVHTLETLVRQAVKQAIPAMDKLRPEV